MQCMQYLYSIIFTIFRDRFKLRPLFRQRNTANNKLSVSCQRLRFDFDFSFDVRKPNDYRLTIKRECEYEANMIYEIQ